MADDDNVVPLAAAPEPSWLRRLQRNKDGAALPTLANALIIMANDPKFDGMMAHNAFTSQHLLLRPVPPSQDMDASLSGPYPRGWGAEDVSLVQAYMQRVWADRFRRADIEAAMQAHAGARAFHPVAEWLNGLQAEWDGVARLNHWIVKVFDPVNYETERDYHEAVASKFLIAAVRRVRHPGCKFDHMPIFEGPQGIGKSTALRRLFGEDYFSDAIPPDLSSRDTALALLGMWCMEFAEIEHLIRNDPEIVKAFFSRQVDRYRPPYGRDFVMRPRQLVMAGTTNNDDYLRDSSGNRRFWPISCQIARVEWIDANRDQLWAEAAHREAADESIWLDDVKLSAHAAGAAAQRMTDEVWEPLIVKWLADPETRLSDLPMTSARVLEFGLGMSKEKMTKAATMRVSAVLRSIGWKRTRWGGRESRIRVWVGPEVVPLEADESRGGPQEPPEMDDIPF
jgi:predicted P-loop ATPase